MIIKTCPFHTAGRDINRDGHGNIDIFFFQAYKN